MVAAKVDASAVRFELDQIATLLSEVSRQMGPQTWQGGSAGNFTIDLRGHSRALERMMYQVVRETAAINQVPAVLDVPTVTSVASQPTAGLFNQVASVSVEGLRRLEAALRRASDALPRHGRRVRSLLAEAGPVQISLGQCERTAAWCASQCRPMRTRIHYALASDKMGTTGGRTSFAMRGVPDKDTFGTAEMAGIAEIQARAYAGALSAGNATDKALLADIAASLRENLRDTAYLRKFFSTVPQGSIGRLAYQLHKAGNRQEPLNAADKRTLADIASAMAALSRKKDGETAVWSAMGGAGSDMPGQALLIKLAAPEVKWSSTVLLELGKAALRWRQKYPSYDLSDYSRFYGGQSRVVVNQPHRRWWHDWDLGRSAGLGGLDGKQLREYDPALNVLGRIASQGDATAARELAATDLEKAFTISDADKAKPLTWASRGNGETYGALLVAPDWMDHGDVAGKVILLATTQVKGHEETAAENAADIMKAVAWWNEKGRTKLDTFFNKGNDLRNVPGLRSDDSAPKWFSDSDQYSAELGTSIRAALLQMTRGYIPTIAYSNRTSKGAGVDFDKVTGRHFVTIDGDEIVEFLRTIAMDDQAWTQLAVDTQRYRQGLYAQGIREGDLESTAGYAGMLDGNMIRAYGKERQQREELTKAQYEALQKQLSVFRDLGGTFLGETSIGKFPGMGDVYTTTTDLGLNKVKHKDFEKRIESIKARHADYSDQLYVDLARAYLSQNPDGLTNRIRTLLREPWLTDDEAGEVAVVVRKHYFGSSGTGRSLKEARGNVVIRWTEDAAGHNAPSGDKD